MHHHKTHPWRCLQLSEFINIWTNFSHFKFISFWLQAQGLQMIFIKSNSIKEILLLDPAHSLPLPLNLFPQRKYPFH